jgi:UDP-galactopyranose mutase
MQHKYDYLIVGAGLYGSVMAHELFKKQKKCLVIEKRNHIGGNIFTELNEGINVHKYGAHIFHTSNKQVWDYVNQFVEFNNFINSPLAIYQGKLFNLPFNMNTFNQLWGVKTPIEAIEKLNAERQDYKHITNPKNLEEQALVLVGRDIYETLIKGYTEKQWGRKATAIPSFIIKRLPIRLNFDNNYFNDRYQGVPIGGYTKLIKQLLNNIEVITNINFFENRDYFQNIANHIIFTGRIDEFFDFKFGELQYRSLEFKHKLLNITNFQGNAVINYTDINLDYTRIIEHKHFEFGQQPNTIITYEFPKDFSKKNEPYYPINDEINQQILEKYKNLSKQYKQISFGGRLGEYQYYDMHQIIEKALNDISKIN